MDTYRVLHPLVAFKLDRLYYCRILINDLDKTVIIDNLETGLAFGTDLTSKPNHEYFIDNDRKIVYHPLTNNEWQYKILKEKKFIVKPHQRNPMLNFNDGIARHATDYELLSEQNNSNNINSSSYFTY